MNVASSCGFRAIGVFHEHPFARLQSRRRLERFARPFRAAAHLIELAVHHEEPTVDDRIGQRHQIGIVKQSRLDFGPTLRIEWIATIQSRSVPIQCDRLPRLARLNKERRPIAIRRRLGLRPDRIEMNHVSRPRQSNRPSDRLDRPHHAIVVVVTIDRINVQITRIDHLYGSQEIAACHPRHGICALHLPRFEYRHLGRRFWSDRRRASFSGGIGATVSRGEVVSDGQANLNCLAGEAGPHRTGDHGGNKLDSPYRSAVRAVLQHCGVGGSPGSSWPGPEAASFAHGRNAFP